MTGHTARITGNTYPVTDNIEAPTAICEGCESRIATETDAVTGEAICAGCRMDREDFRGNNPRRPRG